LWLTIQDGRSEHMRFFWGVLVAGGAAGFAGLLIAYNTTGGPTYTPEIEGQALPMTPGTTAGTAVTLTTTP